MSAVPPATLVKATTSEAVVSEPPPEIVRLLALELRRLSVVVWEVPTVPSEEPTERFSTLVRVKPAIDASAVGASVRLTVSVPAPPSMVSPTVRVVARPTTSHHRHHQ